MGCCSSSEQLKATSVIHDDSLSLGQVVPALKENSVCLDRVIDLMKSAPRIEGLRGNTFVMWLIKGRDWKTAVTSKFCENVDGKQKSIDWLWAIEHQKLHPFKIGEALGNEEIIFVSHRWMKGTPQLPNPERFTNVINDEDMIWMDYLSVPQGQLLQPCGGIEIINNIPIIISNCTKAIIAAELKDSSTSPMKGYPDFPVTSFTEAEYAKRAWCTVEKIAMLQLGTPVIKHFLDVDWQAKCDWPKLLAYTTTAITLHDTLSNPNYRHQKGVPPQLPMTHIRSNIQAWAAQAQQVLTGVKIGQTGGEIADHSDVIEKALNQATGVFIPMMTAAAGSTSNFDQFRHDLQEYSLSALHALINYCGAYPTFHEYHSCCGSETTRFLNSYTMKTAVASDIPYILSLLNDLRSGIPPNEARTEEAVDEREVLSPRLLSDGSTKTARAYNHRQPLICHSCAAKEGPRMVSCAHTRSTTGNFVMAMQFIGSTSLARLCLTQGSPTNAYRSIRDLEASGKALGDADESSGSHPPKDTWLALVDEEHSTVYRSLYRLDSGSEQRPWSGHSWLALRKGEGVWSVYLVDGSDFYDAGGKQQQEVKEVTQRTLIKTVREWYDDALDTAVLGEVHEAS